MKKFLTFLALCCLMVTGAWADGFQASTVENPVVYVLTNANNMTIASNLTYYGSNGSSAAPKGKFAFISTGETDKYKIYETVSQQYVDLTSNASTNCKSGTQLVSSAEDAEVFTIVASNTSGQFLISPTSIGATYLNFNGGAAGNSGGQTVGFWTDGNNDAGSRWTFAEPLAFKSDTYYVFRNRKNSNYVTYNADANDDGSVNHLANAGNSTYSSQALFRIVTNGDEFNIIPAAAPSQYVYAINKNDENSNVGIGALSGEETAATEKYLWNITQVSDGYFTIVPKGGSLSWNCRGSVNGVNVIGQWGAGNEGCHWMIIEVTAPFEAGKTYTMTLHGKNVKYNAGGSNFTLVSDTPEGDEFLYTVGGDPANGYTFKSKGADNYVGYTQENVYTAASVDNAVASPNETAAHYDWYFNGSDAFLKIHGTNNNYVNDNANSNKFSTWNNGSALGGDGSKMTFTEVEVVPVTPDPVTATYTLNPASGNVEASALATITLAFTGDFEDVTWLAEDEMEENVPVLYKNEEEWAGLESMTMNDDGTVSISFTSSDITDGQWTLVIPEGTFMTLVGENAQPVPVAEITATYTVGNVVAFDADKYYTISCLKNGAYASYNPNAVENDVTYLARTGSATSFSSYFRIVANGDYWNIIPAATPDKYVYAITTGNENANVGIGSMDATADAALWQIVKNGDGFNIIPKGGSNGWNCRGSKNGVDVIGQWDHNDTNDNRWVFTEVDTHITDLANLSNDKAYVLICERGQLSTSDGQLVPVAKDREDAYTAKTNKFAIIKSGDKYYLWSVAEDGYVRTDKAIHTLLAAQPITLTAQSDGTFLLALNGSGVNMQENLSNGIIINNFTTPDPGNKYTIYEVGDFADAATAIAAIPGTWKLEDGHIYTIKAHFNGEGQNALYLTKDSNTTLQFAETATATPVQSYWIARATGDDARPWKFQAAYGDGTYLDANNAENALSTTGLNMEVAPIDKNYCYMKASLTGVGNRYIGTYCTADEKYPGFGLYGSTCYGNSLNHSGWTTYYEIAEVTDGSCAYDVISTNENGGVVVSNITDFNGATEVLDGGVVVTAQTITTDNLAPKSIDGLTGNVILDTEAHTITVEYGQNYTVSISGTHAAEAKVLYNGVEYGNTEPFFVAGTPTVEEIAATYYENEYAKITIDEENTTVNVEYRSTANAGVYSIGASTQNILPGKWYIMTQSRDGETPVYNNGENTSIMRAGQNASTVLAPATKFTGVADKYLIRFTEGDYAGTYKITFADGGLWKDNQVKTEAGNYLIKPAVNTSQNKPGLAINVTNDGTSYGSRLDNNGKGKEVVLWGSGAYAEGANNVWYIYPVELDEVYTVTFNLGAPVNQTITGTAFNGQTPVMPFTVPDYVTATYSPELVPATGETTYDVSFDYNDLMPFTPGELTTVDIDIRNHYYFHVEERTITIDGESTTLWLPCISPKAPTFDDDAAYIWRMEGDWYHGFRFHNDQLAKEGEGDGTACHITYKHKEVMSETMEQMEGMKGETSLTEKTYTLESTTDLSVASRATLTGDADDRNSYFELVHATGNIQHYNGEPAEWQFRLMDHKNLYLNFRDYSAVGDNPDSLLCLYGGGYGDNASSFTFHKNEVCTEDDRQAVLAMIDAIEKGAVGALIDKDAQEYQDLLTLKGRIEDTTIGCTRALFDIYTEKLVNANKERKVATDGEAYRLAVRTKQGRNFYLKDDGTYTTDSLAASIYVLGSGADGTKKILAGNNNAALYYFRNGGLTQAAYETASCDLNCELMTNKETVADVLDATGAAKYATVCLTDGNGKVATMTSPDKAVTGGDCEWEAQDVVYMNDELSSAIVMEPVPYPYNKPKFAVGSPDDHEGGYASIWLPYPMIFPDGVEVYRATDAESDGLLVLKKVNTDRVVAAGGYIIRDPNKASTMTVLPAPANPDDVEYSETNAFVGSTENPLVVKEEGSWSAFLTAQGNPTGTPYVLAKKNEGIGYYKYNAGTDDLLPKGKAIWFSNYKADSSSDCMRFTFGDIVEAIKALNGEATDVEIYDLQGHRLNKVEKGQVNVINGKKVMFK